MVFILQGSGSDSVYFHLAFYTIARAFLKRKNSGRTFRLVIHSPQRLNVARARTVCNKQIVSFMD